MPVMHDLVKRWLEQRGYTVREGDYALPEALAPLRAEFECVRWRKQGEHDFVVKLVTANDTVPEGASA